MRVDVIHCLVDSAVTLLLGEELGAAALFGCESMYCLCGVSRSML